ncbi:glucodextranase DOMON-like domain-containing protein [Hyalangium versicolor]|uniref:glucodextranase DOMON-like domain-containing protein n=1 Tax=Hyalangium versicolor TaxID=2861190 RepID=UPI001CCD7294|nr:glucodextranase DOMON-like domain-containing protein [Hyalangium versicolor]
MPLLRRSTLLLALGTAVLVSACLSRGTRGVSSLFTLADPRGDDHGDGELRYPLREDMAPGSMDLLLLDAYAEDEGTRFEATFARPIVRPQAGQTVDLSGESQAQRARFGFYTFNLDLYVDTDRVEGSGRTETMPGRNLQLAPGSGWEKVVLLTPRPYEARDRLRALWLQVAREERQKQQGPLGEAAAREVEGEVARELTARVFFPTRVRVTGATVEFFVPNDFFGGAPRPEWGYALAVTGASLENKVDMPAFLGKTGPQGLMVLPIGPGDSKERFGGGRLGDPNQSPVVDLIVPPGITQEQVLGPNAPPWPAVVPAGPATPAAPESALDGGTPDAAAPTPPTGE